MFDKNRREFLDRIGLPRELIFDRFIVRKSEVGERLHEQSR